MRLSLGFMNIYGFHIIPEGCRQNGRRLQWKNGFSGRMILVEGDFIGRSNSGRRLNGRKS